MRQWRSQVVLNDSEKLIPRCEGYVGQSSFRAQSRVSQRPLHFEESLQRLGAVRTLTPKFFVTA